MTRELRWNKRKLAAEAALRGVSPETLTHLKFLIRVEKATRAAWNLAHGELVQASYAVIGHANPYEAFEALRWALEREVAAEDERDARETAA